VTQCPRDRDTKPRFEKEKHSLGRSPGQITTDSLETITVLSTAYSVPMAYRVHVSMKDCDTSYGIRVKTD
jgi:hypothetical protein